MKMIYIYFYSLDIVLQSSWSKSPTVAFIVFQIQMGLLYEKAQIPIKVVKTTKTQFTVRQCVGVPTLMIISYIVQFTDQIGM